MLRFTTWDERSLIHCGMIWRSCIQKASAQSQEAFLFAFWLPGVVTFEESFPINWYSQYGLKRLDVVRISSVATTRITTPDNWDVLWYTPLTNHNSRVFWQHLKSKHWISLHQTSSYFLHLFAGEFRCFGESIIIESLEKTGDPIFQFSFRIWSRTSSRTRRPVYDHYPGKHTKTIKNLWKITIVHG